MQGDTSPLPTPTKSDNVQELEGCNFQFNHDYESLFRDFDKASAFDRIAELFYDRNFSSSSKSEIELLMFSFYMEAIIHANQRADGVIDYAKCSDYEIAKQLGLTQDRVRTLKLKKQARYPVAFDWQKSLESIKDSIRLDTAAKRIIIPVTDPNLNVEIRNYISSHGGFVDFESGKDYIRIRVEYFLMLMYETLRIEDKKRFNREMKKKLGKANSHEDELIPLDKRELFSNVLGLASTGLQAVDAVIQIANPENTLIKILHQLIPAEK